MARDKSMTNVAGLMIIVMILHHLAFVSLVKVTDYVFIFFMAWFLFKSGMFAEKDRQKKISNFILYIFKKLLLPYVILIVTSLIIGILLEYCYSGYFNLGGDLKGCLYEILNLGTIVWNGSLWFLLTLFLVKIVSKICDGGIWRHVCICLLGLFISYLLYKMPYSLPLYLGNTALGLFFYHLGYLLRKRQYGRWQWCVSCIGYVLILCFFDVDFDFWSNKANPYQITIVALIAGCVAINNVFKKFVFLQNRFLKYVGDNAMPFYTIHGILLYVLLYLNAHFFHIGMGYAFFLLNIVVLSIALPLYAFIYNHNKLQQ